MKGGFGAQGGLARANPGAVSPSVHGREDGRIPTAPVNEQVARAVNVEVGRFSHSSAGVRFGAHSRPTLGLAFSSGDDP